MGAKMGIFFLLGLIFFYLSPYFWDQPHEFEPERFLVPKMNEGIKGWSGLDPDRSPGAMYPNEIDDEQFQNC